MIPQRQQFALLATVLVIRNHRGPESLLERELRVQVVSFFSDFPCWSLIFSCYWPSPNRGRRSPVFLMPLVLFSVVLPTVLIPSISMPLCFSSLWTKNHLCIQLVFFYWDTSDAQLQLSLPLWWWLCSHAFAKLWLPMPPQCDKILACSW